MPAIPINYLAIFVCTIMSMMLGMMWYGPLFGKQWMKLAKFTEADIKAAQAKGMTKTYLLMALGSLVMAYVLAHALIFASVYLNASGTYAGLMSGFYNWLGFVAPVVLSSVLWDGKPWKLGIINAGYYLVNLCLMGVILANWAA